MGSLSFVVLRKVQGEPGMLTFLSDRQYRDCEGVTRRDFLRVGTLGLGAFGLPQLLQEKNAATTAGRAIKNKSVIYMTIGKRAKDVVWSVFIDD